MDAKYDRKFEEMKKYIPFLESMIKRLESTSSASANPRQAQLDKIRSLRDLLSDKKKRMKMENLLKCEQVLINLYAKVEQRDSFTTVKNEDSVFSIDSPTLKEKSELEAVRNKLKKVAKIKEEMQDTLPEIARASELEEVCTPGSKEPALFQRRPNMSSKTDEGVSANITKEDVAKSSQPSGSKRTYTRVLVSPEPGERNWSPTKNSIDKPLFSRRSPRKSPKSHSPYHKKERKKSSKEGHTRKSKDFNITLNVPEESLGSLNTKDILSRIINCSDGDVDIDTLRELRKQILGELKKTGANDDLTDIILKSYNKNKNKRKDTIKSKKREEVEEGELSDSESEAIQSIYGSLIVKEQNKVSKAKNIIEKDEQPRKIQICLVINSDQDSSVGRGDTSQNNKMKNTDASAVRTSYKDDQSVCANNSDVITIDDDEDNATSNPSDNTLNRTENISTKTPHDETVTQKGLSDAKLIQKDELSKSDEVESKESCQNAEEPSVKTPQTEPIQLNVNSETENKNFDLLPEYSDLSSPILPKGPVQVKANFYKPILEQNDPQSIDMAKPEELATPDVNTQTDIATTGVQHSKTLLNESSSIENKLNQMETATEIPLLNEPTVPQKPTETSVSELEILQALKNEILSESIALPNTDTSTPALHQPKVNKVISAKEILPKRISIEKYKQKSVTAPRAKLFTKLERDERMSKQAKARIKLTDKECERFNMSKISFDDDDSSNEEEKETDDFSVDDIYGDLAPQSPEQDELSSIELNSPVLIPQDPVKTATVANLNADVDMRTLPIVSPNPNISVFENANILPNIITVLDLPKNDTAFDQNKSICENRPLWDPRIRRDQTISKESPINPERTPRPYGSGTPNIVPSMTPIMTPNSRSYEMTPSHQTFELGTSRKHVYAPAFSMVESQDREKEIRPWETTDSQGERKSRFDDVRDTNRKWDERDPRNNALPRDPIPQNARYCDTFNYNKYNKDPRSDRYGLDKREDHAFSNSDCPLTPLPTFGRSDTKQFGRLETPMTPIHSFGRNDCPKTPIHPFGRSDCPPTPSHSFGRSDCPTTPIHPFGRSDCPTTPSHAFGRSDGPQFLSSPFGTSECPSTPSHGFDRIDCPQTPSHSFGISECSQSSSHPFGRPDKVQSGPASGRSEFNTKFTKDPRLNRKPEYESSPRYDDKDRDYKNNRSGSLKSANNPYSGPDSHRSRERELSVNRSVDKYHYNAHEQGGRQYNKNPTHSYESKRSMSRNYESGRSYSKDRGSRYENDSKGYEEVGTRRDYHREKNVCRPDENRATLRASSVGRSVSRGPENSLLVKPQTSSRSFTIDTSVNSTFQKLFESGKGIQIFDYSFDVRRQRAASVGRSLVRESSVGRTLSRDFDLKNVAVKYKRETFKRASSVGRELAITVKNKSFQEVKADLKSYKSMDDTSKVIRSKIRGNDRNKGDNYESYIDEKNSKSNTPKTAYSPRKNPRDPRMRCMNHKDPRMYRDDKMKSRGDPRSKSSGIDYSRDNIARGTVLGSGCGVKNYKIPKIKRPIEEKEVEAVKEFKVSQQKDKSEKQGKEKCRLDTEGKKKNKDINGDRSLESDKLLPKKKENDKAKLLGNEKEMKKIEDARKEFKKIRNKHLKKTDDSELTVYNEQMEKQNDDDPNKTDDQTERRLTRSSARELEKSSTETSPIAIRKKRNKKSILNDSDSDSENVCKESKDEVQSRTEQRSPIKEIKLNKNQGDDDIELDSNFGLDELFSDNAVPDPVHDSINDLIAGLYSEVDTSKTDADNNFTKEMSLENMLENITSPDMTDSNQSDVNSSNISQSQAIKKGSVSSMPAGIDQQDPATVDTLPNNNAQEQNTLPKGNLKHVTCMQNMKNSAKDNIALTDSNSVKVIDNDNISSDRCFEEKSEIDEHIDKPNENEDTLSPHNITERNVKDSIFEINNIGTEGEPVSQKSCEDIVSTTETDHNTASSNSETSPPFGNGTSTPDSTINTEENTTDEKVDQPVEVSRLPDSSTREELNESNVTSTHSIESKALDESSSTAMQTNSGLESIGCLLSLLKDKSKIKEVLDMLGSQATDNDKIKKKLEMLSEIMSDEDETNKSSKTENLDLNKEDLLQPTDEKKMIEKVDQSEKHEDIDETVEVEVDIEKKGNIEESDENIKEVELVANANGEKQNDVTTVKKKLPARKLSKFSKNRKNKYLKKISSTEEKRVTRAVTAQPKAKKPSRELLQLQEDIKEMFMSDDVLSSTGIRMCRLAKLFDKNLSKEDLNANDSEPVVLIEKFKNMTRKSGDTSNQGKKKKPGPKPKLSKTLNESLPDTDAEIKSGPLPSYKPGPKSKTKDKSKDPYAFDTDSVETATEKGSDDDLDSDSEASSVSSSKSFGSTECLADIKKKTKRRRPGWQAGVIKPKNKKKKVEAKVIDPTPTDYHQDEIVEKQVKIPDMNCFTDRTYCFRKGTSTYSCRLCTYSGPDIVHHYKKNHPHIEIPLSRMAPLAAKEAIDQCKEINFQAVSRIPSEKYVCIFCFKEFTKRAKSILEDFFWHIVSTHTGEYKHTCSDCVNDSQCPFNLDIPSPPKDVRGQLIGYICKKCNFTQISLENLKTHVIVRHNDEQTAVYTINLSAMSKKALKSFLRHCNAPEKPRVLRSCRSNQSLTEASDDHSEITESSSRFSESESEQKVTEMEKFPVVKSKPFQSKLTFEADDNINDSLEINNIEDDKVPIKIEQIEPEITEETTRKEETPSSKAAADLPLDNHSNLNEPLDQASDDILDYPHFKISYNESNSKEYICCINGIDNHFKTPLLISMKKHVQMKHTEKWDGFCYVCKVIVTPQGMHCFKDCLQHYLEKHIDNFPILEKVITHLPDVPEKVYKSPGSEITSKPIINVRPMSELVSKVSEPAFEECPHIPIIENVVSLVASVVEAPRPSPTYPVIRTEKVPIDEVPLKYEEVQAEVMSNKHRVVLEAMMARNKLIKVYKCAGRFCSFTTDSAEDALLHASTHQRIGGIDVLKCAYCNFDSAGNAIDLVMHVFKTHGGCQYSCGQCFYRAAASQLVGAHMARVHTSIPTEPVLRTTTVSAPVVEAAMLTREQAVSFYVCGHAEHDGNCKFRTYTPDKFHEHLQQKHSTATSHPCNICSTSLSSPAELIQHMKSHGMKLYQCTWCVHGADNEGELLAHVSAMHPSKQPQAYLRIITNKDGTSELRVLPLACLNKTKVPTEDVTPSGLNENPVREAERSIDLEKLIRHANMLIESANQSNTESDTANDEPITDSASASILYNTMETNQIDRSNVLQMVPEATEPSVMVTPPTSDILPSLVTSPALVNPPIPVAPPRTASPQQDIQKTPILKAEPKESQASKRLLSEIVVLDSDEEDSTPGVIDLSDENLSLKFKKVPLSAINVCPRCKTKCKTTAGLKKHMFSCIPPGMTDLPCPHCKFVSKDKVELFDHYLLDHRVAINCSCGICGVSLKSMPIAKRHVRVAHKIKEIEISSKVEKGSVCYFIDERSEKKKVLPKRKLSASSVEAPSPKKRYGPEDIDQLPINPILEQLVCCSQCEFSTKVRLNMVRHLQMHAEQQPVSQTAPVNPVPHLETNEKHFDKMVNLASSSIVTRGPDKTGRPDAEPIVSLLIPPEAASRYPKYVPERQRLTCGAKGCSYISVDEHMLRCHWETLHAGANEYHCVHCPPYQHLDTSKPLTASRILAHLKMHDVTLYACSSCSYYHYKREALEKHLSEVHKVGKLMVVREESVGPSPVTIGQPSGAPTMDLKPWQCGLCKFKSMLRPEVAEHCAKVHQSKMQFKCSYCPFRTSAIENVTKHQTNAHAGKVKDIFYYYYREGQVSDEADGTPRWEKQRQKAGVTDTEIKTEAQASPPRSPAASPALPPKASTSSAPTSTNAPAVDLSLVKKEKDGSDDVRSGTVGSIDDLCKKFGDFCEPNGLHFRCPLCKIVTEDTMESMQSHLYEELKYRKWGCGLCPYKAYHKAGLNEHMASEHRRMCQEPIQLPSDPSMEKWVKAQLDHQKDMIDKNRGNFAKLKLAVPQNKPGSTRQNETESTSLGDDHDLIKLKENFGSFGSPTDSQFCCPKCNFTTKDENSMKDHLETELNKIRWCCSNCTFSFPSYHEAQFHCKSHIGGAARPKEAVRDPAMRQAWLSNVILTQKQGFKTAPASEQDEENISDNAPHEDNSLLVVRYEERVPTPVDTLPVRRKRTAPDSDDESRLVINEATTKNKVCSRCNFTTKYNHVLRDHVLRHFNLKPYTCCYCDFNAYRPGVLNHIERAHPGKKPMMRPTEIPAESGSVGPSPVAKKRQLEDETPKLICLVCEKSVPEAEMDTHLHDNVKPDFGKKGEVVVKCCICLILRSDVKSLQEHHNIAHPDIPINYAYFKLHHNTRDTHYCRYCNKGFKYLMDLKTHHEATHSSYQLMYTSSAYVPPGDDSSRTSEDSTPMPTPTKRCAKKSTTKLPYNSFAKKSTTKLPYYAPDESDGYSYYNTKPRPLQEYANVTTLMPVMNTMVPFSVNMLSEHMKIEPKVLVKDLRSENVE